MDGMILAAGVARRLRPFTAEGPKSLVEVGGTPMLERVAHRLISAGVDRLVINIHHHPEQIRSFVEARGGFGVDVRFSLEADHLLGTGGGVAAAAGTSGAPPPSSSTTATSSPESTSRRSTPRTRRTGTRWPHSRRAAASPTGI